MKKRKVLIITVTVIAVLVIALLVGSGYKKRTDVLLSDYTVSDGGTKLVFHVDVMSSMGYVRAFENSGGGVKSHYLTFYATFGGPNSSLGAKEAFELQLSENDTQIYFNRADGGYELVLQKNAQTGEWEKP